MIRRIAGLALIGAAALTMVGSVEAARGGQKGGPNGSDSSSSSGGTVFVIDQAAPIVHGQTITFTVETTEADRPFSKVNCYRGGVHVYSSSAGHFDDYNHYFGEPDHLLASLNWPSGDADCTASLEYMAKNGRMRTITAFDFHVDA
jgi:hypothetical protein